MLFRLHAMFHRREYLRLAHEGGELEKNAAKLRAVSEVFAETELPPPLSNVLALQREELYESDDHINKNYLPFELGDIFERTGETVTGKKKYILLAQPCDLMIRRGGKREPELSRIPLAEVVLTDKASYYSEEMPYFGASPEEKWFVKFKLVHFVRACLLDLCVFNQDGEAKLIIGGDAPSWIRPTWKKRYDILSKHWRKEIGKADKLVSAVGEQSAAMQIKNQLFNDDLFKGGLAETDGIRTITYNCKRVGRLSRARAIGLLMAYTATLARPAYDRSFG